MAQALSNLTKAVSSDEDADPAKARAFGDTLLIGLFAAANLPRPLNWIYKKPVTAQILACVTPLYLFLTIQFGSCPFTWLIGLIVSPDGRLTLSIVTIAMVLSTCINMYHMPDLTWTSQTSLKSNFKQPIIQLIVGLATTLIMVLDRVFLQLLIKTLLASVILYFKRGTFENQGKTSVLWTIIQSFGSDFNCGGLELATDAGSDSNRKETLNKKSSLINFMGWCAYGVLLPLMIDDCSKNTEAEMNFVYQCLVQFSGLLSLSVGFPLAKITESSLKKKYFFPESEMSVQAMIVSSICQIFFIHLLLNVTFINSSVNQPYSGVMIWTMCSPIMFVTLFKSVCTQNVFLVIPPIFFLMVIL